MAKCWTGTVRGRRRKICGTVKTKKGCKRWAITSNTAVGGKKKSSSKKGKSKAKSSGATFKATAKYAKNKDGSTRKGCRKVKGGYRCRKPGK
jgi:hypothetical protein